MVASVDVLLIDPPWRSLGAGSLALATLGPILRGSGISCGELHGMTRLPKTDTDPVFLASFAGHLFVPSLHPEVSPAEAAQGLIRHFVDDVTLGGLAWSGPQVPTLEALGFDGAGLGTSLIADMARAERCIERCVADVVAARPKVVGLSATFETQLPAALALAGRIARGLPQAAVILGGAACFGPAGAALLQAYAALDIVCVAEADELVVPLVRAVLSRDDAALAQIGGLALRGADGTVYTTAAAPLVTDLDALPEPDYDAFLAQHRASAWADRTPRLLFETSRGCWWGQVSWCTFCGLNAEGMAYRKKSPARAVAEIVNLSVQYPEAPRLHATDNILDMGYLQTVLPTLAARGGPRLFYETKTNLTRSQVAALAAGGVDLVQPGVESFHDGVLGLMKKGNTALGQLQFIKWAEELGVGLTYNLIVRNPGEEAGWYEEMTALVPRIAHLTPPDVVSTMWLERFSPYARDPAAHGIERVRPKPYYRDLFRAPGVDLARLAYVFDFDHRDHRDAALVGAQRRFLAAVRAWQARWRPGQWTYALGPDGVVITDRRRGAAEVVALAAEAGRVFRSLDRSRGLQGLARDLGLSRARTEGLVQGLVSRGWVVAGPAERYLAVIPREA